MENDRFYVTTAIDYPSSTPHIGHAYQKIVADVLARWNKIKGKEVRFLTGTDEHGKKIAEAAKKRGKDPKKFVDELSALFKESWKNLDIEYDRFIRTTDKDHEEVVREFIKKCSDSGDIYKSKYEGLYCIDCEAYYTEKDSDEGNCPIHGKPLEKMSEESYFFKLSKYQDFLLNLYKNNPKFILPESRRKEIINRVKEGLRDLSITRTSFDWGVPFPLDEKHVTYVWFDALVNYLSGSGKDFEFWPADVHLLGKDNTWFHTVYWPAMLKSAGYELPKTTFNHGFLSFDKQKISKSLGNVISPKYLSENYGADSVRYFICRNFPFASGEDGDFNEKYLVQRHNDELADKLGNLVSRVAGLIEKKGMEKTDNTLLKELKIKKIEGHLEKFEIDRALSEIFGFIDKCNEYIQEKKPWQTDDKKTLYEVADSIKAISILLWPFIPSSSEKIAKDFGFSVGQNTLKNIEEPLDESSKIEKDILFKKIEFKEKVNKTDKPKEIMEGVGKASFSDWEKLDLRVAEINSVEEIDGADKLWKINLDAGELGKRVVCAGIKEHYSKEELEGKKVVYFSNLEPKKLKGVESQGMLLAASDEGESKVILLTPEKDIENGAKIS